MRAVRLRALVMGILAAVPAGAAAQQFSIRSEVDAQKASNLPHTQLSARATRTLNMCMNNGSSPRTSVTTRW